MVKAKIEIVNGYELDPAKKYLILLKKATMKTASLWIKALKEIEIKNVVIGVEEWVGGVKIIEQKKKEDTKKEKARVR